MAENNSFDEFRTNLLKRNTKKDFKIKNSLWSKSLYRSADKSHPIRQVTFKIWRKARTGCNNSFRR